jgi:polyisoprenoid-binding protein YceI
MVLMSLIVYPGYSQYDLYGKWEINKTETTFYFRVQALGIITVKGTFTEVTGVIDLENHYPEIEVNITVQTASIESGNKKRNQHLKSGDFFDVVKYPEMTFTSNKILERKNGNNYLIEGILSIKDVSKKISVPVQHEGFNENSQIRFYGSKKINRRDYNIDYSGKGVSDEVEISFVVVADLIYNQKIETKK